MTPTVLTFTNEMRGKRPLAKRYLNVGYGREADMRRCSMTAAAISKEQPLVQAAAKGPTGNAKWQNRSFATAEKKRRTVVEDIYRDFDTPFVSVT